jgi:PleD family two-component response regulator
MNRRVLAAVDDLLFASKIRGTAEQLNVTVEFAKKAETLFDLAKAETPDLIILDLNSERLDPLVLAKDIKADEQLRGVPLVGFLSHVQTDLMRLAQAAGVDQVLPRSAFTKFLPEILTGEFRD